jgi:pyruvate dehydrogenase E1 component alpha subunit
MHMFDREHNMLGGYGIVGGHIPLAAGVAFASKYRADGRVTLCFFGEGAVSDRRVPRGALARGAVEASHRLHLREQRVLDGHAALAIDVGRGRVDEGARLRHRPRPLLRDDVLEVEQRIGEAVKRAREESLPTLVEVRTYRFRGHSMSDPASTARRPSSTSTRSATRCTARLEAREGYGEPRLEQLEESRRGRGRRRREVRRREPRADASPMLEATTYSGPFAY